MIKIKLKINFKEKNNNIKILNNWKSWIGKSKWIQKLEFEFRVKRRNQKTNY